MAYAGLSPNAQINVGRNMSQVLEYFGAASAGIASIFWFLSARKNLPKMVSYYGSIPNNDPFFQAIRFSVVMNRWAAAFSGLSALCVAIGLSLHP
jgi:hypothetical protein